MLNLCISDQTKYFIKFALSVTTSTKIKARGGQTGSAQSDKISLKTQAQTDIHLFI